MVDRHLDVFFNQDILRRDAVSIRADVVSVVMG